jgi:tRNA A37 methylthiotransferase MiaB
VTSDFRSADIILFNACALTEHTQDKSVEIINRTKAGKRACAELIVHGYLPKINEERIREVYQGPTFRSDEVERANEIFQAKTKAQDIHANFLLPHVHLDKVPPYLRKMKRITRPGILMAIMNRLFLHRLAHVINVHNRHSFCIKVSTGCLSACSYCAIRLSRGRVKSKPIDNVVKEFEEGLEKDYKDFALIGTDLESYGRDQGTNLVSQKER